MERGDNSRIFQNLENEARTKIIYRRFLGGSLDMWLARNACLFEDKFIPSLQCVVQSRSIFFNYKLPKSMSKDSIFTRILINKRNGVILTVWGNLWERDPNNYVGILTLKLLLILFT